MLASLGLIVEDALYVGLPDSKMKKEDNLSLKSFDKVDVLRAAFQ